MKSKMMAICACVALTVGGGAMAQTATSKASAAGAADNTNSKSSPMPMRGWMMDYSKTNKGYISRQAYMDEMSRRWDTMDANHQGLTPQQIDSMYGYQAGGAPTPGHVKAGNSKTNPTGTELKGQNSGGK
jgi:hypothetical protein